MADGRLCIFAAAFAALSVGISNVWAHREDYLDKTLVYMTLGKGEVEPEYWLDYGYRDDEQRYFMRHSAFVALGITEHWMIEGGVTGEKVMGRSFKFESALIETRLRFKKANGPWMRRYRWKVSMNGRTTKRNSFWNHG